MLLVLGSLLPYVSEQFLNVEMAWRLSSIILSCSIFLFLYFEVLAPTLQASKENLTAEMSWLLFSLKQALLVTAALALLFVSLGYDMFVQEVFVLCIYALLVHAATSLIRLLLSLTDIGNA